MMDEDIVHLQQQEIAALEKKVKAADKRGYQRGYAAGLRKGEEKRSAEQRRRERQETLDSIYLALLPAYISTTVVSDGKAVNKFTDKVVLAAQLAEYAMKRRPIA